MRFIADLHIHSKYSRATSKQMNLEDLDSWADDKGILVMATGDFLHGKYLKEIKGKLIPAEPGLFKLKKEYKKTTLKGTLSETRFILSVEISGIYKKGVPPTLSFGEASPPTSVGADSGEASKVRRIHNLVFMPSIESVEKLRSELINLGCNLDSDGRPIIGLDSEKLAEIVFDVNKNAAIIPAHAWTPWFSIFGSMSGFDSIEECFGKYADKIFAIETGLSSDPAMNWQLSSLDKIALISNSDSHSLPKIGREANIFNTELSYQGIMQAIKSGAPQKRGKGIGKSEKFVGTIEFFPEEGKYHYDGHSKCKIVFSPKESKKHKNICPVCGKPLVIGVMNRVEKLADRKACPTTGGWTNNGNYHTLENRVPYYNLVQLDEIIAEAIGVGPASKKVKNVYENLIKTFGSELNILMDVSVDKIKSASNEKIAEGIKRVREGNLKISPGYDGEYGTVEIF